MSVLCSVLLFLGCLLLFGGREGSPMGHRVIGVVALVCAGLFGWAGVLSFRESRRLIRAEEG